MGTKKKGGRKEGRGQERKRGRKGKRERRRKEVRERRNEGKRLPNLEIRPAAS